uniref:PH domain-containing protein n=1 Tax=Globisporangium ultimum (strain ATCC 200006 / CBS 805.95 / DAOM BR144) TaxID=431595 RepID=K3WKU7_GLOUD
MQKARSNSNPVAFQSPRDATVLWHGWLKKLGRFSKRWRRRYFVFVSTTNGTKELRHYDACRDVATLLVTTPKGVITMTDAIGICCFLPTSPPTGKKPPIFNRSDGNDADLDSQDQKFAVITPLGLSLLAALSAFYPAIDVLHSGWMTKKRERTVHSAKSIMSYWKRHFFVFLATGDLLYFRDESLNELQGRVDVRHAPTVRVTGERMIEEKKKETSLFKFTSKMSALERRACLVWIATPPSKMFVLKLQDDHDVAVTNGKRNELTPAAKSFQRFGQAFLMSCVASCGKDSRVQPSFNDAQS